MEITRLKLLPLLFVLACATTGLVVQDRADYERAVRADADNQLVDLETLDIPLDVRYATPNNFMKTTLYPVAKAYLRAPAARALVDVQRELAAQGLGIKVFDAYRPYRVTVAMWEPIKNPDYVADPAKGSRHNRGAAVDLTLIDLKTGAELAMPTPYDDFTSRAAHAFNELPEDVLKNRALLRDVMTKHGFEPLPSEWWHYDFGGWERFALMDVDLAAVPSPR
ncbi:MAG TPA: M15 family metallopeptidase [Thermoanaerobaculia bacterium]|nr:M15 family metallopeptidase [Thermoanaerobaculia bacterium]